MFRSTFEPKLRDPLRRVVWAAAAALTALLPLPAPLAAQALSVAAAPAAAPAIVPVPIPRAELSTDHSQEQVEFTTGAGTFAYVPAWRLQVDDERLLMGLVLANTFTPDWRAQIAPALTERGTRIGWGDLPVGALGRFQPHRNRITLSRTLEPEAFGVLAAVLAHEVAHAVSDPAPGPDGCFAEEAQAFAWEARTWAALPERWRSRSAVARALDGLVRIWQRNGIMALVTGSADYQRECRADPSGA